MKRGNNGRCQGDGARKEDAEMTHEQMMDRAALVKAMRDARARIVKAPTGFDHLSDAEIEKMAADLNAIAGRLEAWEPAA
jgi:hypothetical protein